jgi:hypothetical protein
MHLNPFHVPPLMIIQIYFCLSDVRISTTNNPAIVPISIPDQGFAVIVQVLPRHLSRYPKAPPAIPPVTIPIMYFKVFRKSFMNTLCEESDTYSSLIACIGQKSTQVKQS